MRAYRACGGRIPVVRNSRGFLGGVEVFFDKGYAASLLATEIRAEFLLILIEVEQVYLNSGKPDQRG